MKTEPKKHPTREATACCRIVVFAAKLELLAAQTELEATHIDPLSANRLALLARGLRSHASAMVGVVSYVNGTADDLPTDDPRQLELVE